MPSGFRSWLAYGSAPEPPIEFGCYKSSKKLQALLEEVLKRVLGEYLSRHDPVA
jgi:hypothetical protein